MKDEESIFEVENCCVSCGAWIPEGMQVCPHCEHETFRYSTPTPSKIFGFNVRRNK